MSAKIKATIIVAVSFASLVCAAIAYRSFVLLPSLEAAVLNQLKDPESAQFKDLRYVGNWTKFGGMLCGKVNAKNELGGYAGFSRFWVLGESAFVDHQDGTYVSSDDPCAEFEAKGKWWWLRW